MTASHETDSLASRLVEAARLVAQTDRPDDAAQQLTEHIARTVKSDDVSLWLLERGETLFVSHGSSIPGRWNDMVIDLEAVAMPKNILGSSGRARRAVRWRDPSERDQPDFPGSGTLVIGRRVTTVIGFVIIADRAPETFTEEETKELELCAQLLVQIYQREFAYNHLRASRTSLDFAGSEQDLFESLILQVAESARMEFVALREYDDAVGGLRTLETWGFDRSVSKRRFDLVPLAEYPPFVEALSGRRVVAGSMHDPKYASLLAIPELKAVKSFVAAPIRIGDDIFGVLSVGARCEYEYNTLEGRAFEGMANAAGLAIRYYRTNHEVTRQIGEFTEISTALTAVEVAQAGRHEAIVKIANASLAVTNVETALAKPNVAQARERLKEVRTDHDEIEEALNKISLGTIQIDSEFEELQLQSIWQEAWKATVGKLARVDVKIGGADPTVLAVPDRLRQVFINLFLNSADAFESQLKRNQRMKDQPEIVVRIEGSQRKGDPFIFTYRDNAGGLQQQLLRATKVDKKVPEERILFEKGVTSKESGTGYGLWLANRFMQQHAGSIAVVEQRRVGLMFGLELPHPSTVHPVRGRLKPR